MNKKELQTLAGIANKEQILTEAPQPEIGDQSSSIKQRGRGPKKEWTVEYDINAGEYTEYVIIIARNVELRNGSVFADGIEIIFGGNPILGIEQS